MEDQFSHRHSMLSDVNHKSNVIDSMKIYVCTECEVYKNNKKWVTEHQFMILAV